MILDTNIIIHLINAEESVLEFFEKNNEEKFSISVITEIELRMGRKRQQLEEKELSEILEQFTILPLNSNVGRLIVDHLERKEIKSLRNTNFQDIIIGCTAMYMNKPLVTLNTRDFNQFRNLQIITP